ncbi:MAG: histidine kinase [Fluviicola sp.]|nr:histidine kinase [Fluviicola sp.]
MIPIQKKSANLDMRFGLLILFLSVFTSLFCQRGVMHYTRENGLVSNEVNDITHDEQGFLWLATNNGIERFDGQRFIHFVNDPDDAKSISSNQVNRIIYDRNGFVWCATKNNGLIQINTKTFIVKNFYPNKQPNGLIDNQINAFCVDANNELWMSPNQSGLCHYSKKNNTFIYTRPSDQYPSLSVEKIDNITAILQDKFKPELLWCTTFDGLFSYNKSTKKWKRYQVRTETLIEKSLLNGSENKLFCLEQDGKGNLYIGLQAGVFLYFDQVQGVFRKIEGPSFTQDFQSATIKSLNWRDKRYLYVCIDAQEFLLFDTKTKTYIRYDEAERTIKTPNHVVRFGSQIAVCSQTNGFYIHNEELIFGQRIQAGKGIVDLAVNSKTGDYLKAYNFPSNQLVLSKNGAQQLFPLDQSIEILEIHSMHRNGFVILAKDRLLQLTATGTLKTLTVFGKKNGLLDDDLTALTAFNDGDSILWIGTKMNGLMYYSFKTNSLKHSFNKTKNSQNNRVELSSVQCFVKHKNQLFFGLDQGLGVLDLRTKKRVFPSFLTSIPRDQIRSLAISSKKQLWIGTESNGVLIIDLEKQQIVNRVTARMGLQSQQVDQIVFDKLGHAWIKNPACIAIVNTRNLSVSSLESRHGMENVQKIIVCEELLFFLVPHGYIQGTIRSRFPKAIPPKPYIQRVKVLNGELLQLNKKTFAYDQNNLTFEFGVLDYSNGTNNFVSYRLKGLDENWRSGNGKDQADYYNLSGGNYVFELRVIEDGKIVSVEYPFKIIPPFWKRWWFIAFIVIVIAFSIWFYVKLRIRRIENTERMKVDFNAQIREMEAKALRAQMNPHFLFNSLNSIRLFILKNEVENASDYIAKFSKLLRMILNHSRQDMITVYDEIQSLKLYLEFERLRFDGGFDFDLQIDGQEVLDCQIPPMIIQPFVENAIWHGLMPRMDDKGYIMVSFKKTPGMLSVIVQDNGIGREKAKVNNTKKSLKEGSVGLQITKDRLRGLTLRTNRMNDFEIIDLYDDNQKAIGTLVKLNFETGEKL